MIEDILTIRVLALCHRGNFINFVSVRCNQSDFFSESKLRKFLYSLLLFEATVKMSITIYTAARYKGTVFRNYVALLPGCLINLKLTVGLVVYGGRFSACSAFMRTPIAISVVEWCIQFYCQCMFRYLMSTLRTAPCLYGALLVTLALFKAVEYRKAEYCHASTLVKVLVVDQIIYFAL